MGLSYSLRAKKIIDFSAPKIASQYNSEYVEPEHLLSSILNEPECLAMKIVGFMKVNVDLLREQTDEIMKSKAGKQIVDKLLYSNTSMEVLAVAEEEARLMVSDVIGTEHILLGIVKLNYSRLKSILSVQNVNFNNLQEEIYNFLGVDISEEGDMDLFDDVLDNRQPPEERKEKGKLNILDKFTIDLNEQQRKGRLDPVIGRIKEIQRIIEVLSRRTKNNPILVGEPGVGKSAILEGIAERIVNGQVPVILKNKRILNLDMPAVVAGTKYRGEFEDRLKKILTEATGDKNVILFIDEFHTVVGAGSAEGSLDAANILKPSLARGELQIIGATTFSEYKKYIEKDKALERRMQSVKIQEPSVEDTISILQGLKSRYEHFHKVVYSSEALEAAVTLSKRFITEKHLPDKAIDLIDEAGARTRTDNVREPEQFEKIQREIHVLESEKRDHVNAQKFEKAIVLRDKIVSLRIRLEKERQDWERTVLEAVVPIGKIEIQKILASWLNMPVEKVSEEEGQRLLKMEAYLNKQVIGQHEAIKKLSSAVRRARIGLQNPKRPIGSFLFLGPTGVGKTLLAKMLTEFLFESDEKLIRLDMSDFMEKFSVSRLVGAPPGYVGYKEGGVLTEKVRQNPYSVVLFDEIEKAHPDVFNILLQIMEEGQLSDNLGHTVDFRNVIIILTSNAGTRGLDTVSVGFEPEKDEKGKNKDMERSMRQALKKLFNPEFLNRLDANIVFKKLGAPEIKKIFELEFRDLNKRLLENRISVNLGPGAKKHLVAMCQDEKSGARAIKRILQKEVKDRIAEELLRTNFAEKKLLLIMKSGKLVFGSRKAVQKVGS